MNRRTSRSDPRPTPVRRASRLMALEPRYLFDGVALTDLGLDPLAHDAPSIAADPGHDDSAEALLQRVLPALAAEAAPRTARELLFVDPSVPGLQALLDGVRDGVQVVTLDAQRDALVQIGEVLAGLRDVDAVHLLSHGSAGALQLAGTTLDADTLAQRSAELDAWRPSLGADADLLLYGCDIAAGETGVRFIGMLAQATGADVAASDDATGAASRGGDWTLEQATGPLQVAHPFDDAALLAFDGVLAANQAPTVTFTDQIAELVMTADNRFTAYLNGEQIGSGNNWNQPYRITNLDILPGDNVLAIRAVNDGGPEGMQARMLLPSGSSFGTSSPGWRVVGTNPGASWADIGFDDSAWHDAVIDDSYPWPNQVGDPAQAWLWTNNNSGSTDAYPAVADDLIAWFRYEFTGTGGTPGSKVYGGTEQVALALHGTGIKISDADAPTGAMQLTLAIPEGAYTGSLSVGVGTTGVSVLSSSAKSVVLSGTLTQLNALLAGSSGATFRYTADIDDPLTSVQVSATVDDLGQSGDGGSLSGSNFATIQITPVNDAPVLTAAAASFTENGSAVPLSPALTLADADDTQLSGATVQITANLVTAADALAVDGTAIGSVIAGTSITVSSYDAATGKLTLTGTDSLANYQQALRLVTFRTTGDDPAGAALSASRTVTWSVIDANSDGVGAKTGTATSTVTLAPVNDAPALTALDATSPNATFAVPYQQNGPAVVIDPDATLADAELSARNNWNGSRLTFARAGGASADDVFGASGTSSVGLSMASGAVKVDGTAIGTYTQSGGTLVMTFNASATTTRVNEALRGVTYANAVTTPGALAYTSVTLSVTFDDQNRDATGGGTAGAGQLQGSGGLQTASGTVVVNIDRAPVANADSASLKEGLTTAATGSVSGDVLPAVTSGGDVADTDPDGDALTVVGVAAGSTSARLAGQVGVDVAGSYGTLRLQADGSYTYTLDNSKDAVQAIARGGQVVDTFSVTVAGARGASTTTSLAVTILGTNDTPVIRAEAFTGEQREVEPGPLVFTLQQYTGFQSNVLQTLRDYVAANPANYTVETTLIDYTDDPGGFAGDIPGSRPWPAAVATGASGTGGINNEFFARLSADFSIAAAGTYTFRTFNDDGVFLLIDDKLVLSDTGYHPEAVVTGTITLAPGNHSLELFFYEGGGEASLELSVKLGNAAYQLVGAASAGFVASLDSRTMTLNETDAPLLHSETLSVFDVDDADAVNVTIESMTATGSALAYRPAGLTDAVLLADLSLPSGSLNNPAPSNAVSNLTWRFDSGTQTFDWMDAGDTIELTYTLRATDTSGATADADHQSPTSTETVVVTITGANDAPVITAVDVTGAVTEDTSTVADNPLTEAVETGAFLTDSGSLTFDDPDTSDIADVTLAFVGTSTTGPSVPAALTTALGSAMRISGDLVDAAQGSVAWAFALDNALVQYLGAGQTVTATYRITVTDDSGYAMASGSHEASASTKDVTVTITGTNDMPVITLGGTDASSAGVTETNATLTASGTLSVADVDLGNTVAATVPSVTVVSGRDNGIANATLRGLMTAAPATVIGSTASSGTLTWTFNSGTQYFDHLEQGETLVLDYTVRVTDSSSATADQTVRVTVTGTNDLPTLTIAGASATEAADARAQEIRLDGNLSIADKDVGNTLAVAQGTPTVVWSGGAVPAGYDLSALTSAVLTLGADTTSNGGTATIAWSYAAAATNLDFLAAGQTLTVSYPITVTDEFGATHTTPLVITIQGSNDAPLISLQGGDSASASFVENAAPGLSASGTLSVADLDFSNIVSAQVHAVAKSGTTAGIVPSDATLKTFMTLASAGVIDATHTTGTIGWAFDAGSEGFDYLGVGETLVLTYTLRVTDSAGATADRAVTVTITGVNDAPQLLTGAGDTVQLSTGNPNPTFRLSIPATGVVEGDTVRLSYLGVTQAAQTLTAEDVARGWVEVTLSQALTLQDSSGDLAAVPVKWADWTSATTTSATGTISTEVGAVSVTLSSASTLAGVQVSGSTNYWLPADPYLSPGVAAPSTSDIVRFNTLGDRTLTFGTEVTNLYFGFVSMNGNGYRFDRDFDILSQALTSSTRGYWGYGEAQKREVVIDGVTYYELYAVSGEPHGVIRFKGSFSTLTWNNPTTENWHGFTVGVKSTSTGLQAVTGQFLRGSTVLATTPTTLVTYDATLTAQTGTLDTTVSAARLFETDAPLSASGSLSLYDIDTTDVVAAQVDAVAISGVTSGLTLSQAQVKALLTVSSTDTSALQASRVSWNFASSPEDFDWLAAGEELSFTYSVSVDDGHGGSDASTVTITVVGTNDAPVVTPGVVTGAITEASGDLTRSGSVSFTDLDLSDSAAASVFRDSATWSGGSLSAAQAEALYAGLSITPTALAANLGTVGWTYSVAESAIDFLAAGQTATLKFYVQVQDAAGAAATSPVTIMITGTNDAPVLADTALALGSVAEDSAVPAGAVGTLVSTLVGGITDVDAGNPKRVAIVGADTSHGSWYYSTNGGTTWASFTASEASARLLAADTQTRLFFKPDADWAGTLASALTLRAWDGSDGRSNGGTVDLGSPGSTGGTTAYSVAADTVSLTVTTVNDRPTATADVTLPAYAEDASTPTGTSFASLASSFGYSDAVDDQTGLGGSSSATSMSYVAIVGNASIAAQGRWQVSTKASPGVATAADWIDVPTTGLSTGAALVFAADRQLRFVPAANFHGTPGALTLRLADGSAVLASSTSAADTRSLATVGGTGTTGAWTAVDRSLSTTVSAVNDAPTLSGSATLPDTAEDVASGARSAAAIAAALTYGDATDDRTAIAGGADGRSAQTALAVVANAATAAQGQWQVTRDGGSTWTAISTAVGATDAIVLDLSDAGQQIRFVPGLHFNGVPGGLTLRAADGTWNGVSGVVDLSGAIGGSQPWSATTGSLGLTVGAVDDAPVVDDLDAVSPNASLVTVYRPGTTGWIVIDPDVALLDQELSVERNSWQGATLTVARQGGASAQDQFGAAGNATSGLFLDAGGVLKVDGVVIGSYTNAAGTLSFAFNAQATRDRVDTAVRGITYRNDAFPPPIREVTLVYTVDDGNSNASTGGTAGSGQAQGVGGALTGSAGIVMIFNSPPEAHPDTATLTEGIGPTATASVSGNVIAAVGDGDVSDTDADGDPIAVQGVAAGDVGDEVLTGQVGVAVDGVYGRVVVAADGTYTYTLDHSRAVTHAIAAGTTATDVFSVTIHDGFGGTDTATLTLTIVGTNDAPVLGDTTLVYVGAEDDDLPVGPVGTTVRDLLGGATDPDNGGSRGVAITSTGASYGRWYYTLDGGSSWAEFSASDDRALLLPENGEQSRVHYLTWRDWFGSRSAELSLRAWDRTSGTAGGTADLSLAASVGGETAFSAATDTVAISMTPVNDAPTVVGTAVLAPVSEDAAVASVPGATAASLFAALKYSDGVDAQTRYAGGDTSSAATAIAIVGNTASTEQGTWQVSLDGGTGWRNVPLGISDETAIVLPLSDGQQRIRFVPAADFHGTPGGLAVRVADGTWSTAGRDAATGMQDLRGAIGGTAAWSAGTATIAAAASGVNDAPTILGLDAVRNGEAVQGGVAVVIDGDVVFGDRELFAERNDASGARLTIARAGGAQPEDQFGAAGALTLTAGGRIVVADGAASVDIGAYVQDRGTLTLSFGPGATAARVSLAVQGLTYRNVSTAVLATDQVTLRWTFDDQNRNTGGGGRMGYGQDQGTGGALSAMADIVVELDRAPVANADSAALNIGLVVDGAAAPSVSGNVLAGAGSAADSDPDGDLLTVQGVAAGIAAGPLTTGVGVAIDGLYGSLTLAAQGGFVYVADAAALTGIGTATAVPIGAQVTDRFTTTVSDGRGGLATSTLTVTITRANDAPVLDPALDLAMTQVEDALAPRSAVGVLVSSLTGGITDPNGLPIGIAVTDADSTHGTWYFSVNGGSTWTPFTVAAADASARLLAADTRTRLYFQPSANWTQASTPALSFRAWDPRSGANGGSAMLDAPALILSPQQDTVALTVTGVNDKPVLGGLEATSPNATPADPYVHGGAPVIISSTVTLADADLDASAAGWSGATLTVARSVPSADDLFGASGDEASGLYFDGDAVMRLDGVDIGRWAQDAGVLALTFGDAVSTVQVQSAARGITYANVAATVSTSTVTLVFTLDDQNVNAATGGVAGDGQDQGPGGKFTASAKTVVTINRLPVAKADAVSVVAGLAGTVTSLAGDVTPTYSSLGHVADTDADRDVLTVVGVAVDAGSPAPLGQLGAELAGSYGTLVMQAGGNYVYSVDNDLAVVRGLGPSDTLTDTFAYTIDDGRGGRAWTTLTVTIKGTNDAPQWLGTTRAIEVDEDTGLPAGAVGVTVAQLFEQTDLGQVIADADDVSAPGIAVVGTDVTRGKWYYSINDGASWAGFTASVTAARLLPVDARLAFVPTAQWNGDLAAGLTIRAWDGSKGTLGGTSSAAVVGGSTPFSAESATVALRVRPVNDAPTITKLTATSVNASTIRPYVEGAAPIVVDTAVTLADLDLASGNGGAGQWAGATLTVERDGGSHPDDVFGASGSATSGLFLDADGVLKVNGIAVGSYVSADGRLTMSFESSATTAVVNTAARGITYFNAMTNDRSARTVRLVYSLDDGAGSADVGVDQGSGGAKTASASILLNLNRRPDAVDDVAVLANPTLKAVVRGDVTPLAGQPGADSDLDGQSLTVKGLWLGDDRAARLIGNIGVLLQGQYGTLLMYGTGSYTYTVNRAVGDAQTDVFTYLVDDGRGGQSTATLTIRLGGGG